MTRGAISTMPGDRRMVLLRTADAAALVGVTTSSFKTWARRRDLRPVSIERDGRARVALWDADQVLAATAVSPHPWRDATR
ncbi:hypothetical protein [Calidifontibacter indicus]|uniref:hypothetical protein n=1 Tax=Calidifontibacter indicus TaxID=419650 RepID=UPI003D728E41